MPSLPVFLRRSFAHLAAMLLLLRLPAAGAVVDPAAPTELPPEIQHLQPGTRLTLFAERPQIVTPTGIDVDAQGRVWAVASHTHFRPDNYAGPKFDEILVLEDTDRDGRADRRAVFFSGTTATMDLELGRDGWVYLAERSRVLRARDTDGDGRADQVENLAVMQTTADYPHNGLSGLAWHPSGDLVFALGENFAKDWTLTGTDGSVVNGSGEGGIFRCTAEGAKLRRLAKGFWNPFGLCVLPGGEIFAAENDPGSRPPCRLLHIVEGGDYGYQRAYGEAPFHPFVCWNGELRGTLPMVAPTGEAPCGIAPLGGGLLVPSWADHRIDFFPLRRKGASYTSGRVELLRGGEFFRPVCLKQTSPTTYFLTDWVFGSYELHQRGRVWKLEIDPARAGGWLPPQVTAPPTEVERLAAGLQSGSLTADRATLLPHARHADPFVARFALLALARQAGGWREPDLAAAPSEDRVSMLLALKLARPKDEVWPRYFLRDANSEVQFETLRWISDEQLAGFKPDLEKLLRWPELDFKLFEAALAAWNTLNGNPRAGVADVAMLVQRLTDGAAPAALRAYALRLLPPAHGKITMALLRELLQRNDPLLTVEVTRTLAAKGTVDSRRLLNEIAADATRPAAVRADAIAGLAAAPDEHLELLLALAGNDTAAIRDEALRALRFTTLSGPARERVAGVAKMHAGSAPLAEAVLHPGSLSGGRPPLTDLAAWERRLAGLRGDAETGRRLFFHPRVALCATCHRHEGRGNVVGPDLSAVAARQDPRWLLHSLLQPGAEVAPQFFPWSLALKDGEEFVGIMLRKGGRGGREFYRDTTGREQSFLKSDIASRRELKTSLMPEGLVLSLTDGELRDLLAFLGGPAGGSN